MTVLEAIKEILIKKVEADQHRETLTIRLQEEGERLTIIRQNQEEFRARDRRSTRLEETHIQQQNQVVINQLRSTANFALNQFIFKRREAYEKIDNLKTSVYEYLKDNPQLRLMLITQWKTENMKIQTLTDVFQHIEAQALISLRDEVAETIQNPVSRNHFVTLVYTHISPREPSVKDMMLDMVQDEPQDPSLQLGIFSLMKTMKLNTESRNIYSDIVVPVIEDLIKKKRRGMAAAVELVHEIHGDIHLPEMKFEQFDEERNYEPLRPLKPFEP